MPDLFISYAREDKPFVKRLHEALSSRNKSSWVDWEGIPPTAEWLAEIRQAIEASDNFVFVITPDSVGSDVCKVEVAHASEQNKRLVPIVRRDASVNDVPEELARLNWIFMRPDDEFDGAVESLIEALDADLEWVRLHTRLLGRARTWDAEGRDKSLLLRGQELQRAEEWLAEAAIKEPKPTPLQTRYIPASRQSETKRQRFVLGAVTAGLVVAVALAIVAFVQRGIAEERRSIALTRQLAAEAGQHSLERGDPEVVERGAALAVEALRRSEELALPVAPDVDAAARTLLARLPSARLEAPVLVERLTGWNSQGDQLAVTGRGNFAYVWNVDGDGSRIDLDHGSGFWYAIWSPQGDKVATGGADTDVRIWSPDGSEPAVTLSHTRPVSHLWWSPSGDYLATRDFDDKVRLWSLEEPDEPRLLQPEAAIESGAWSPDGRTLALLDDAGIVTLHPASASNAVHTLAQDRAAESLAWSPRGQLATLSIDGAVQVWSEQPDAIPNLLNVPSAIESITWDTEGRRLAAVGDSVAWIWNPDTGAAPVRLDNAGRFRELAWQPHGMRLAALDADGLVHLWDDPEAETAPILIEHEDWVSHIDWSLSGTILAASIRNGQVGLWPAGPDAVPVLIEQGTGVAKLAWNPRHAILATLESVASSSVVKLWQPEQPGDPVRPAEGLRVELVSWSPDADQLVMSGGGAVTVWPSDGRSDAVLLEQDTDVSLLSWDPAGDYVAVAREQSVELRAVGAAGETRQLELGGTVVEMRWNPSGSRLAAWSNDGTITVWSKVSGDPIAMPATAPPPAFGDDRQMLSWSPDGERFAVATGRYGALQILPGDGSGEPRELSSLTQAQRVAWSTLGDRIATLRGNVVSVFSMSDESPSVELEYASDPQMLAWQPQSNRIATVDRSGDVELIDLGNANERVTFAHGGPVSAIEWSPDGLHLATGGEDGIVKLWNAALPNQPVLLDHGTAVSTLAWSPDSERLASVGGGDLRVWAVSAQLLIERLCDAGGRNLTPEEWELYVDPEEPWRRTCEGWAG